MIFNKIKAIITKYNKQILIVLSTIFFILIILPICTRNYVKIDKEYDTVNDVSLYIYKYNSLPKNFVTKAYTENSRTNWNDSTTIRNGYNFGGDNYVFMDKITDYTENENLKEADIYSDREARINADNRGEERLVYSHSTKNIEIYYTSDHYKTFRKITMWEIQKTSNILWIVFFLYTTVVVTGYVLYKKY